MPVYACFVSWLVCTGSVYVARVYGRCCLREVRTGILILRRVSIQVYTETKRVSIQFYNNNKESKYISIY